MVPGMTSKSALRKLSGNPATPLWLRLTLLAQVDARVKHTFPDGSVFTPETPEAWYAAGELARRMGTWDTEICDMTPLQGHEVTRAIALAVKNGGLWADSEPTCLKPVM